MPTLTPDPESVPPEGTPESPTAEVPPQEDPPAAAEVPVPAPETPPSDSTSAAVAVPEPAPEPEASAAPPTPLEAVETLHNERVASLPSDPLAEPPVAPEVVNTVPEAPPETAVLSDEDRREFDAPDIEPAVVVPDPVETVDEDTEDAQAVDKAPVLHVHVLPAPTVRVREGDIVDVGRRAAIVIHVARPRLEIAESFAEDVRLAGQLVEVYEDAPHVTVQFIEGGALAHVVRVDATQGAERFEVVA